MGWTGLHRSPGMTDRQFFEQEFPLGLQRDGEILDCTTIRNVFYAAVRQRDDGKVWGLVVLIQRTRGEFNFSYKEMDEDMGPGYTQCPDRILDLLSGTEQKNAVEWRAECRAHNAKRAALPKVEPGQRVRFTQGLRFTDGTEYDTFELIERSTFRAVGMNGGTFGRYRIPNWKTRQFEKVPTP